MIDQHPNVIRFPRRVRRGRTTKARSAAAQIHAIPPARHRTIVGVIANEMRRQPTQQDAEEHLIEHLHVEAGRLADLGIPDHQIEIECRAFARAVWVIVLRGDSSEGVA